MIPRWQGRLPVQRRLLTNSSYAANPVLVNDFIVIPDLLGLGVIEFRDGDF